MKALSFVAVLAVVACGCSNGRIKTCGLIPGQGCPIGRGGTCEDETCDALYACVDGAWVKEKTCDQTSTGGGGSGGSAMGGGGQGGCNGVTIDRTGQAEGCSPPLQEPDCPAAAAELCRPCQTVCVDFFLCKQEGWVSVAFCDEEGNVVLEP